MIKNVMLGADPELFLVNKNTGKMTSAIGLIFGEKDFPQSISDNGHGILTDNVAVEFVFPPCSNVDDYIKNINFCKDYIKETIPNDLEISNKTSAYFDEDQLEDESARIFGCSSDYNIYTRRKNQAPDVNIIGNLRAAGAHIHVGWNNPTDEDKIKLIKAMDLFLGLPSLLMNDDNNRRKLYGKAGCYRFKSYGLEYRTLDNTWVLTDDGIKWAWNNTMLAIEWVNNNMELELHEELEIIQTINTNDRVKAVKLCEKYSLTPELIII